VKVPKGWTEAEVASIENGLREAWQAIRGDIEESAGRSVSKSARVEIVLDADYFENYGHVPKDLVERFRALKPSVQKSVARETFKPW
jgi:hypothetical protein